MLVKAIREFNRYMCSSTNLVENSLAFGTIAYWTGSNLQDFLTEISKRLGQSEIIGSNLI